jgi:hypothetical protein
MSRYRLLGSAENPQEIANALDIRRRELGLRMADLDDALGFTPGYVSKIFARGYDKNLGPQSLPAMLTGLGCRLVIVHDEEAELPPIIRRTISERTGGAGIVSR